MQASANASTPNAVDNAVTSRSLLSDCRIWFSIVETLLIKTVERTLSTSCRTVPRT